MPSWSVVIVVVLAIHYAASAKIPEQTFSDYDWDPSPHALPARLSGSSLSAKMSRLRPFQSMHAVEGMNVAKSRADFVWEDDQTEGKLKHDIFYITNTVRETIDLTGQNVMRRRVPEKQVDTDRSETASAGHGNPVGIAGSIWDAGKALMQNFLSSVPQEEQESVAPAAFPVGRRKNYRKALPWNRRHDET